jgi:hypothetical protein
MDALPLLVGDQPVSGLYYERQFEPNSRPVSCRLVPCEFPELSDQSINERVDRVRGQVMDDNSLMKFELLSHLIAAWTVRCYGTLINVTS